MSQYTVMEEVVQLLFSADKIYLFFYVWNFFGSWKHFSYVFPIVGSLCNSYYSPIFVAPSIPIVSSEDKRGEMILHRHSKISHRYTVGKKHRLEKGENGKKGAYHGDEASFDMTRRHRLEKPVAFPTWNLILVIHFPLHSRAALMNMTTSDSVQIFQLEIYFLRSVRENGGRGLWRVIRLNVDYSTADPAFLLPNFCSFELVSSKMSILTPFASEPTCFYFFLYGPMLLSAEIFSPLERLSSSFGEFVTTIGMLG